MVRLRWNLLLLGGALFFIGFSMWLNESRMSEGNPFNDSLFPLYVILGLLIGLPYYVAPFIMKLKSPNIDGFGLSETLDNSEPLFAIDMVVASNEDGVVETDVDDVPVIIYPKYNSYNLGSAAAFGLKMRGGGHFGIGVFPADLCHRNGTSVHVLASDIRAYRTLAEKRKLPQHVLKAIEHEYRIRGWTWRDEFPIYWGEVPIHWDGVPTEVANMAKRCEQLEELTKGWEKIARDYENEALKNREVEQPPMNLIERLQNIEGRDES